MSSNNHKIKIEKGVVLPTYRWQTEGESHVIRTALQKMSTGDSFVYRDSKPIYRIADQLGMKIVSRKLNGSGFRIWKVKGKP